MEEIFHSSSTANVFQLASAFDNLRQGADQSVLSFINDVLTAASDLKHLGEDISDQKIKWQILANLLPEYAPLVTTLTNVDRDHLSGSRHETIYPCLFERFRLRHLRDY